jgi:hypothetical protein
MPALLLHKEWPFAGMLALSLALGVAIAAGVDAWGDSEEVTAAALFADCAAALVIAAAMVVLGRLSHFRPFNPLK